MIKRSGAFALTLLYLVTVVGFALNLHFCGSYLVSVKINAPVKSCNMLAKGKMKCCTNRHLEVKVKDAHQGQSQLFLAKTFAFEPPKLPFADFSINTQWPLSEKYFDRGPPDTPPGNIDLLLKNCIFRI
jgi:hypothetical protein